MYGEIYSRKCFGYLSVWKIRKRKRYNGKKTKLKRQHKIE